MKKYCLLFVLLLLLSSCSNNDGKTPISDEDFRTGTEGLDINFIEQAPPDNVWESSVFEVGLDFRNLGAYDISNSKIVVGYEPDYMSPLSQASFVMNLRGKSFSNPDGEADVRFLRIKTKNLEPLSETHKSLITVTACYSYETIISQAVCVDSDTYNRYSEKACTSSELSLDSQGAPVAVTRIVPKSLLSEDGMHPGFMIFIENLGNGRIINPDKIADFCSNVNPGSVDDWNVVRITADLGGEFMNCNKMSIKLKGTDDFVHCTLERALERPEAAYTSALNIVLDYGYTFSLSKEITIDKQRLV